MIKTRIGIEEEVKLDKTNFLLSFILKTELGLTALTRLASFLKLV